MSSPRTSSTRTSSSPRTYPPRTSSPRTSSFPKTSSPQTSRLQIAPQRAFQQMASLQKRLAQKKNRMNMITTPKSVKSSLATFDAIYASGKPGPSTERGRGGSRQKGRRNLLHSLEDQSEQSSENIHIDCQQQVSSHATFDVCVSDVPESSPAVRKSNPRASGSSRAFD